MAIPSIYKHNIEITKPWSKEMYTYNERIKEYMIREIMFCIDSLNNRSMADKLAKIINPYGYGEGYELKEIKVDKSAGGERYDFLVGWKSIYSAYIPEGLFLSPIF